MIRTVLGLAGELEFERAVANVESVERTLFAERLICAAHCSVIFHDEVRFQCAMILVQLPDMHVVNVAGSGHIDQRG